MSTTVIGLYDEYNSAERVVDALEDYGFGDDDIHVNAHDSSLSSSRYDSDDLHRGLTDDGVPEDDARTYAEGVRRGGTLVVVDAPDDRAEQVAAVMNVDSGGDYAGQRTGQRTERSTEREGTEARRERTTDDEEARVTEAREELHVGKREKSEGRVRLHKRVEEKPVKEDVRLEEEEVEVDTEPATRARADEDVFEEETVEMEERREEPVVEKETKVEGEVVAHKEKREHEETVSDTVRETKVDVEEIGEGAYDDYDEAFREHHRTTIGAGDFGDYEPAYRLGHRYSTNDEYRGRDWTDVQPQLRRDYEERHGEGTFEDVKEAARYGYNRPRHA